MNNTPSEHAENALSPSTQEFISHALRFFIVGFITTAVTFLSFVAFYRVFRVNEYMSNMASYILGLINSYVWNKLWTFGKKGVDIFEIAAFLVVFGASYAVQLGCYALLRKFGIQAEYSQILAMAPYTMVNFLGNKYVTFK